jgi:cellulose synthase (UDP-forming)
MVWLAAQLGVRQPGNWANWLQCLLWLPPQQRPQVAPWLHQTLRVLPIWSGRAARLLAAGAQASLRGTTWPLRYAMAALDRLAQRRGVLGFGLRAEQVLAPWLEVRGVRAMLLGSIVVLAAIVLTTPFSATGQLLFLSLCWALAMVLRRLPGRFPSLALACVSMITLGRYVWWRATSTLDFDSLTEAVLGYGLLVAESYTWLIVLLGFVQTAWPLKREPVVLRGAPPTWPTVDVFIPTYNEPLSVVQPTVLAALGLDWPADKLRIYLLDDGRRPEFRHYAESVGIHYLDRPDNRHAKAGNLNHALDRTDGELVAIFDCDHIPTRTFLKTCVGWFQRDPKCAMLQTPHHFFSPDPFERNLGTFRRVPNEGSLFYGLIQDGNDFWNAAFFCGSCAVIRRGPLMEIGGIAVETVTEDAHTALKLHRRGYNSAYLNQPLAAGLATESLSAHVGQRIRWARGMAQIFRLDNPLLGLGLSLWQRLCYATAMLHFFFGLPRLVFLTAPMAYLFFEWHIINAHAGTLALYVLPYILMSNIANAHLQGESRHTFWADVYETVLAAYVMVPTAVAMVKPHAGTFKVTAKGGLVAKSYFDWVISTPYSILVLLNLAAFVMGLLRLFVFNVHETGTVALNLAWTTYSMLILGAAMGVASETRQVRRTQRVETRLPAVLYLDNGQAVTCECLDYSMTGLGLQVPPELSIAAGERVHISLWSDAQEHSFAAQVLISKPQSIGLQFEPLSHRQRVQLVQCTFARPDAWLNWKETHDADRPLQGLKEIALLGLQGYWKLGLSVRDYLRDLVRQRRTPEAPSA